MSFFFCKIRMAVRHHAGLNETCSDNDECRLYCERGGDDPALEWTQFSMERSEEESSNEVYDDRCQGLCPRE